MKVARFLCSGFFVAGDNEDVEAQSVFICECKTFLSLCNGLTHQYQCQANARKLTKTIQVHVTDSLVLRPL